MDMDDDDDDMITRGFMTLLDEARERIKTLSVEEAMALHGNDDYVFIDLRETRELEQEGMVPGAFHAPRGILEFWVDPDSPYHKEIFASGKSFVFYCWSGWRSALATRTVQEMGLTPVCHVHGGLKAWKDAGGPIGPKPDYHGR